MYTNNKRSSHYPQSSNTTRHHGGSAYNNNAYYSHISTNNRNNINSYSATGGRPSQSGYQQRSNQYSGSRRAVTRGSEGYNQNYYEGNGSTSGSSHAIKDGKQYHNDHYYNEEEEIMYYDEEITEQQEYVESGHYNNSRKANNKDGSQSYHHDSTSQNAEKRGVYDKQDHNQQEQEDNNYYDHNKEGDGHLDYGNEISHHQQYRAQKRVGTSKKYQYEPSYSGSQTSQQQVQQKERPDYTNYSNQNNNGSWRRAANPSAPSNSTSDHSYRQESTSYNRQTQQQYSGDPNNNYSKSNYQPESQYSTKRNYNGTYANSSYRGGKQQTRGGGSGSANNYDNHNQSYRDDYYNEQNNSEQYTYGQEQETNNEKGASEDQSQTSSEYQLNKGSKHGSTSRTNSNANYSKKGQYQDSTARSYSQVQNQDSSTLYRYQPKIKGGVTSQKENENQPNQNSPEGNKQNNESFQDEQSPQVEKMPVQPHRKVFIQKDQEQHNAEGMKNSANNGELKCSRTSSDWESVDQEPSLPSVTAENNQSLDQQISDKQGNQQQYSRKVEKYSANNINYAEEISRAEKEIQFKNPEIPNTQQQLQNISTHQKTGSNNSYFNQRNKSIDDDQLRFQDVLFQVPDPEFKEINVSNQELIINQQPPEVVPVTSSHNRVMANQKIENNRFIRQVNANGNHSREVNFNKPQEQQQQWNEHIQQWQMIPPQRHVQQLANHHHSLQNHHCIQQKILTPPIMSSSPHNQQFENFNHQQISSPGQKTNAFSLEYHQQQNLMGKNENQINQKQNKQNQINNNSHFQHTNNHHMHHQRISSPPLPSLPQYKQQIQQQSQQDDNYFVMHPYHQQQQDIHNYYQQQQIVDLQILSPSHSLDGPSKNSMDSYNNFNKIGPKQLQFNQYESGNSSSQTSNMNLNAHSFQPSLQHSFSMGQPQIVVDSIVPQQLSNLYQTYSDDNLSTLPTQQQSEVISTASLQSQQNQQNNQLNFHAQEFIPSYKKGAKQQSFQFQTPTPNQYATPPIQYNYEKQHQQIQDYAYGMNNLQQQQHLIHLKQYPYEQENSAYVSHPYHQQYKNTDLIEYDQRQQQQFVSNYQDVVHQQQYQQQYNPDLQQYDTDDFVLQKQYQQQQQYGQMHMGNQMQLNQQIIHHDQDYIDPAEGNHNIHSSNEKLKYDEYQRQSQQQVSPSQNKQFGNAV